MNKELFYQEYDEDSLCDYERDLSECWASLPQVEEDHHYVYAIQVTVATVKD